VAQVTVYAIAQLTIHDRARYQRYAAAFLPVLTKYGGQLLRGDRKGSCRCGRYCRAPRALPGMTRGGQLAETLGAPSASG